MAEPTNEPTNEPTTEPTGDGAAQTTDWESKYREAIQHSRTWEYRSKENYSQVQALTAELDKLKAAKPDEQIAAANQRADEAEAQLASYKHDAEVNSWKAAAAKETGVPAELLNARRKTPSRLPPRLLPTGLPSVLSRQGFLTLLAHPKLVNPPTPPPKPFARHCSATDILGVKVTT